MEGIPYLSTHYVRAAHGGVELYAVMLGDHGEAGHVDGEGGPAGEAGAVPGEVGPLEEHPAAALRAGDGGLPSNLGPGGRGLHLTLDDHVRAGGKKGGEEVTEAAMTP